MYLLTLSVFDGPHEMVITCLFFIYGTKLNSTTHFRLGMILYIIYMATVVFLAQWARRMRSPAGPAASTINKQSSREELQLLCFQLGIVFFNPQLGSS